jgi:hypothetical protein
VSRLRHALDSDGAEQLVRSSVTVERFVFATAYIMRKLEEADALTVDVEVAGVQVSVRSPAASPEVVVVSEDAGKTWRQPLEDRPALDEAARPQAEARPDLRVA